MGLFSGIGKVLSSVTGDGLLNFGSSLVAGGLSAKGDVRDSSFIEQEADNVAYLFRLKGSDKTVLKVTKARKTFGDCEFHPNNKFYLEYRDRRYYETSNV